MNNNQQQDAHHVRAHGHPRAIDQGFQLCVLCDHAVKPGDNECSYCHTKIHSRNRSSLQMVWAWVITAAIFYIPAMIFPVSTVIFLGADSPSTLIESVVLFWQHGAWHVAMIIFIASVFIPGFKIMAILYIAVKIQQKRGNIKQCRQVTNLYKFIEFIGRWSMIDVFVVALLVALVQFGGLATIQPGLGIFCFSLVVIASIVATNNIDIRLLWDKKYTDSKATPHSNKSESI